MAIRKEHDPFERTLNGRIASAADKASHLKKEFLEHSGFRKKNGRMSLRGPAFIMAVLAIGPTIGVTTDDPIPEIPHPSTIMDENLAGAHNDLRSYVYTEIGQQAAYVLLQEEGRYELYTSPNTSPGSFSTSFSLVSDAALATDIIENYIIPNLSAGEVHEEARGFTGYDHLEFCPILSEPFLGEEDGLIDRIITCNPYAENTDEWVEDKLDNNQAFWQHAAENITVTNYGFSADEIEARALEQENAPNTPLEQGFLYSMYLLLAGAGAAGIGAVTSNARRKRDEHYANKTSSPR